MSRKLKISFIGVKGVPAEWGGIEVYVEEVARRLVERGHDVNVYSRRWYSKSTKEHLGIKITATPTLPFKATDAIIHGLTSSVHSCFTDSDIVHYHGLGSYFFSFLPRLAGKKVVGTMHSADWLNPKWGYVARALIRGGVWCALRFPHRLTVVAKYIGDLLKIGDGRVLYTPGGVAIRDRAEPDLISKFGLERNGYILFMGRFEEQKRIDWIIKAYKEIERKDIKLVIAGGSSHCEDNEYRACLSNLAGDDENIIFSGYVTGWLKEELLSNALLVVLPSVIEGLPLTLLEALSYGLPCLVSDISANREFIDQGLVYHFSGDYTDFKDTFSRVFDTVLSQGSAQIDTDRIAAVERNFSWHKTVDKFESIYKSFKKEICV